MKYVGNVQSQANAEVYATASGTLPNGKPVVVNSDGTVSVVASTGSAASVGSKATFESDVVNVVTSTFDSNSNKLVIAYRDTNNSNYGTAVVGTVSGASISFGTPVVFLSVHIDHVSISFDTSANKVVIAYQSTSSPFPGKCRVGTVSGTGISFGTEVTFNSNFTTTVSVCYDSNSNKTVVSYSNKGGASGRGEARVGTISGTNISFGSVAVFESGAIQDTVPGGIAFDSNSNKVVISYTDSGNSNYGTAIVGTISGTNISFGTAAVFNAASTSLHPQSICFDTNSNKIVIGYSEANAAGKAIVGTVSGTGISFGTAVLFQPLDSARITSISLSFDSSTNIVLISYIDTNTYGANTNHGVAVSGTVSGTSISISNPLVFNSTNTGTAITLGSSFDSNENKVVISFRDGPDVSNSMYGKSVAFQPGNLVANLTAENFVGITNGVVEYDEGSATVGSAVVFESAEIGFGSATFDSNSNKVVVVYRDQANTKAGTAVIGTVSGTSITFGTPVVYRTGGNTVYSDVVFDSNSNKLAVVYTDYGNSGRGAARVGTVSGTTISFGTEVVFDTGAVLYNSIAFDSNLNKVVIAYKDGGDSNKGKAIVGTISGTDISFGTAAEFEAGATSYTACVYDENAQKFLIAYQDSDNSSYATAVVGTVSGTNISFGTPVVIESATSYPASPGGFAYDPIAQKSVLLYHSGSGGKVVVGTISGTNVSFGTAVSFSANTGLMNSLVYDSEAKVVVLVYRDGDNSNYGTFKTGSVSGTSITVSAATVFEAASSASIAAVFDSNSKKVVATFEDKGNSSYGTATVIQIPFNNTVRGSTASGSTAIIQAGGAISTLQTGLTAGQQYFVQTDGTLGLTAASPSVIAGTAVSATDLIVKG